MLGARIEVILEIDEDQMNELESQGETSSNEIEKRIENAITLTASNMRQPVNEIVEVRLLEYI